MRTLNRRRFIELGGVAGTLAAVSPGFALGAGQRVRDGEAQDPDDRIIRLTGDGLGLTTTQYSRLLAHLAEKKGIVPDSYILDGVVDELEKQCAHSGQAARGGRADGDTRE